MAVKFTEDQQRVIDTRNRNILVSAAAGSGKTAVLVERIIQKICDDKNPVDIDRLLIVTFTQAAAAQMRERISKAVMKKLEEQPENEHLQKQSSLIHNAQITTIDSFCLFIIRNHFNDIGIDPGFRVADESEIKMLEHDVMDQLLEEEHAAADEKFLQFVECYSTGAGEKKIEEAILRLYHFAMSYPLPEEWLNERKNDYKLTSVSELPQKQWFREALKYLSTVLNECINRLHKALSIASGAGGPSQYVDTLAADIELVEKLCSTDDYATLYDLFTYSSFGRLSSKKVEGVDPALKDMVKGIRDEVKKTIADIKKFMFQISPEDTLADMGHCQEIVEELVRLTLSFKERLDGTKRDKNIVDFSDMEHFALQILLSKDEDGKLVVSDTALDLQDYFDEIMIDEYQDSNEVQELLLKSVSGEDKGRYNRFIVGDVKQSIYKFRLARPEIFMEKYNTYVTDNEEEDKVRIDLSMNFRSRREVTEATNFICGQIMKKEVGNVEYDEKAALYVGASYPEPEDKNLYQTEIMIASDSMQTDKKLSEKEIEACMVAERIKSLVGHFPVTDSQTGEVRPARYSDIVLLFRATSGWDEDFRKILSQRGIPVHVSSKAGYFQTLEIQGIINLLRVLDNPLQDIPFFGTLKLPYFDFSEEEIAVIRLVGRDTEQSDNKKLFLYEQAFELIQRIEEPENAEEDKNLSEIMPIYEKLVKAMNFIDKYRKKIAYTPIKELIGELINEMGYGEYIGSMPGGDQRRANLELLLEKAGAFEKTSFYGLFHFIRYIENIEEQEVDFGEANILDENADVVRIMTIHKSKGLEFPICFVCGLSKQFNQMDIRQGILMDVDLGVGVECINPVLRTKRKTFRKNIVAQRMKEDTRGEDLRVLYVALTRAKEKLILTAYQDDIGKKLSGFMHISMEDEQKLPYSIIMSANSYLDLILAALIRHSCMSEFLDEAGFGGEHYELPYQDIPIKFTLYTDEENAGESIKEQGQAAALEEELEHSGEHADYELEKELQAKLEYEYPHKNLEGLTVKTTVSELKKAGYEEAMEEAASLYPQERESYIPRFVSGSEEVMGTQYGTAVHKIMELMSYSEKYLEESTDYSEAIQEEMNSWLLEGLVRKEDIECVDIKNIERFFHDEIAGRMVKACSSGKLYREQPFVLGIPADKLKDTFPSEETVLIQGVIDVFFYEENEAGEDEIVLLDYKTDRVMNIDELSKRYKTQLDYYEKALTEITGHRVKERIIYSFCKHKAIKV